MLIRPSRLNKTNVMSDGIYCRAYSGGIMGLWSKVKNVFVSG